ncbi:GGDEF domain-containing protein [Actinoplanes sp. NPDC049596]|uniref:GGDEF domain-containing protein n=1 Tax=unclassified Actinoplanes TaxID=2626549 RepID=UPI0034271B88
MRKLILVLAAGVALQAALPHLDEGAGLVLGNLPIAVAGLVAWAGFRAQARRHTGRERAGLLLGSGAGVLLGVSYLLYALEGVPGPAGAIEPMGDLASIAAALVSVPGVLLASPPFPDWHTRLMYLIEVVTAAAAIFAVVWQFVLVPAGADPVWVATLTPEIVTAALALMMMSRTSGRNTLQLLAVAVATFALAGVLNVRVHAFDLPWYSYGLGGTYLVAGLLFAMASREGLPPADPTGWRAFTSSWSTVSTVPTVLLMGSVVMDYRAGGTLSPVLFAVVLGSAVMAIGRQFLSLLIVRRLRAELDDRAFRDPLTGLPNRAAFHRHAAGQEQMALLWLDLDGFKAVNDTLGHAAGDALLAAVGARLAAELRPGDLAARLGGDEFAVILSGADEHEAAAMGARLLDRLAEPVPYGTRRLIARGSVGVSAGPGEEIDRLLHEADTALYAAKAAGKGVVRGHAAA